MDLSSKDITYHHIEGADLSGPADISILNDTLYIPNLTASELVIVSLK